MQTKKQARDAYEFCLVLTPTPIAPIRAREAIRQRFLVLADEIRRELGTVVEKLVEDSVERGRGKPIIVTVALGAESIRGEVVDQDDLVPFEIPLRR